MAVTQLHREQAKALIDVMELHGFDMLKVSRLPIIFPMAQKLAKGEWTVKEFINSLEKVNIFNGGKLKK